MNYFLRLYVESSDKNVADNEAIKMLSCVRSFGKSEIFNIQPYWKIDTYFEVSFDIESGESLIQLSKRLADYWTFYGNFCIWNFQTEAFFISKKVRWASLEIIE